MRWRTTLQNKKILRNTLLNIVTRKDAVRNMFRTASFQITILFVFNKYLTRFLQYPRHFFPRKVLQLPLFYLLSFYLLQLQP